MTFITGFVMGVTIMLGMVAVYVISCSIERDERELRSQHDVADRTYHYCETAIAPDTPAKYYGGDGYIPADYRIIIEQADDGAYRTQSLQQVIDQATKNDSTKPCQK